MHEADLDWPAIRQAVNLLEQGELVAFPTETVYGLGADAENPAAVAKIYAAKGRPADHPVIVHLAPEADAGYWAQSVPPDALRLIEAFWPGPLTLILKRAAHIPDAVSGGQDSIGLRCPSHPVAQALLRTFRHGSGGVAAPSANRFGHVSPTTARHVHDEFDARVVRCVLDGGQSAVGIESTIVDLSRGHAVLLRPGHVGTRDIADVIGYVPRMPDAAAPRASGTLESHYAPRTPVVLLPKERLDDCLRALTVKGRRAALMHYRPCATVVHAAIAMPAEPAAYAHDLYAALRELDQADAKVIVIEAPPTDAAWHGVNDRLRRAAHDSTGILARLLQD